jgi:orotidine-5'-phosphate decarboxylase
MPKNSKPEPRIEMNKQEIFEQIKLKRSFLCVGLDTDIDRIPKQFLKYDNPVLEFNKAIIEITAPYAVAYKPNTAFYERYGAAGWNTLHETIACMPANVLKIADAKRGDIGNTSGYYAKAFFETMQADAVTVAPYMGADSVLPFLEWKNKWTILLALTSNAGSADFQLIATTSGSSLYEEVVQQAVNWGDSDQLMFVVGATNAVHLSKMRKLAPDHFFLVPGVGAQGGSLADVAKYGMNDNCGLLVNASRSIIYADNSANFEESVELACKSLQAEMESLLKQHGLIA